MVIDQISHRYIAPSSAAFRPDSGEDGLSVYRDKVLSSRGLGPQHVAAAGRVPSIVAGLIDAQIHVHGLAIESDPMPVPPDVSAAHALVTGWHSMRTAGLRTATDSSWRRTRRQVRDAHGDEPELPVGKDEFPECVDICAQRYGSDPNARLVMPQLWA
jgi:hypothetical protein